MIALAFLYLIGLQGMQTTSFSLHPLSIITGLQSQADKVKSYSGHRVSNESLRMVYFHDQTVGIVELGPKKLLLGCEFIEVYQHLDAFALLSDLENMSQPLIITFEDMLELMSQCGEVEAMEQKDIRRQRTRKMGRGMFFSNPLTLLNGIIPGTKWCGTGDIAQHYHDLGADADVDRCCRTHDLCPVKIRANKQRYNIVNKSYYTKTHCACDDRLFECLKSNNGPTAQILGNVYFNLVQVPCIDTDMSGIMHVQSTQHTF